ncbi:MAG: DUF5995 family protein [Acidimicrobiales bacterium]
MLRLESEIDAARRDADRRGWFAAMYRQTTRAVRDRVVAGAFDDAERMGRFVERFAGRYLGPMRDWREARPVPRCWRQAFGVGPDKLIIQHLLLGMNAHVNFDLAVVAAETCPGTEIHAMHDDFVAVNDILGGLMPGVRSCIGRFSPLLDVIDRVGGGEDDEILNFSIRVARDQAWSQALVLAPPPRIPRGGPNSSNPSTAAWPCSAR